MNCNPHPFFLTHYTFTWDNTHQQVKHVTSLVNTIHTVPLSRSHWPRAQRPIVYNNIQVISFWKKADAYTEMFRVTPSGSPPSDRKCLMQILLLCMSKIGQTNREVHKELFHQHGVWWLPLNCFQHNKTAKTEPENRNMVMKLFTYS